MRSAIGEGRTEEEALDRALKKLGATLDRVRVKTLEGKKGRLCGLFGGGMGRIEVTHQQDTEEKLDKVLTGLLRRIDIPSQVEVRKDRGDYYVEVVTVESDGLLIGKHGETLHAIEHLMNRIIHKDQSEQGRVRIDVGGYRERRDDQLRSKAVSLARKVKESGKEMITDPLYSPDRRVVHLALTGDPQIRTYTVGDGLYKSVVVAPSGGRGGGRPSDRPATSRGGRGGRPNRDSRGGRDRRNDRNDHGGGRSRRS